MTPLLTVRDITKTFHYRTSLFHTQQLIAVQPVSFALNKKQTLAIVGENGSGKSTLAKMIVGMIEPTAGEIFIQDQRLEYGDYSYRSQRIRMIFQDPGMSLNPKQRVGQLLDAPLKLNTQFTAQERETRIDKTLRQVGLRSDHAYYYPNALAAGQKQRIALARALILQPDIIIADEALASLDVSIRAQMINLLLELQEKTDIAYIYVSQQLGVVKHISDKMMVMHQGEVVEYNDTATLLADAQHPVSQRLIASYFADSNMPESY